MPLPHVNLTPSAYAILGLLHEQPMHGYEIARHFKPDSDLGQVVPADISTVYSFLKDLQEHGLLSGKRETVGARPPRTVFSLTADAAEIFLDWVYRPVARIREVRLDFLLKLYFARRLSATKTHALIEAQLTICRDYRTRQRTQAEALDVQSFEFLVLRSKLTAVESTLNWLQELATEDTTRTGRAPARPKKQGKKASAVAPQEASREKKKHR